MQKISYGEKYAKTPKPITKLNHFECFLDVCVCVSRRTFQPIRSTRNALNVIGIHPLHGAIRRKANEKRKYYLSITLNGRIEREKIDAFCWHLVCCDFQKWRRHEFMISRNERQLSRAEAEIPLHCDSNDIKMIRIECWIIIAHSKREKNECYLVNGKAISKLYASIFHDSCARASKYGLLRHFDIIASRWEYFVFLRVK